MNKSSPHHSTDINAPLKPLGRFFRRFHLTLFIVFVIAFLVAAVVLFANILESASSIEDYTSPITAGNIDQSTLDRMNEFHTSDGTLPERAAATGRNNPFSE